MAEKLTPQQKQAVTNEGGKLLVSAAAGSGKTKVLVDRILRQLTDPVNPANIDDFLIITYTKAAAAELRGKIASKLAEKIAEDASNRHLQIQMQRLYLAKISTVHAFCADIIRDYAYKLDISVDFRVAEENECIELQARVLQRLIDEAYENAEQDTDFCVLVDTQGIGRDDRLIPQIVLKLYNSAMCHLDPNRWLDRCLELNEVTGVQDASQTVWGKYLINDLHNYLDLQMKALNNCADRAASELGFDKPALLLRQIVSQLDTLRSCDSWDGIIRCMDIDYGRISFPKGMSDSEMALQIKAVRENCKKGLAKKLRRFSDDSRQILSDIAGVSAAARALVRLVKDFINAYDQAKKSKRIMDFADLEHKTLDLLLGKQRTAPTMIAREIGNRYREVMVDEYQDSNGVQDAIFTAITAQRNNCFMVGDVKQSIYQFRLADPGIFLEKYNTYESADIAQPGKGRKVFLSNNFRSSNGVLQAVNDVFSLCMSPQVGGLDYTQDEALYEGIPHVSLNEPEVELYGISVAEDTYEEEAAFVAHRICQLLDGKHMVRNGDQLRPIRPEDIVILLRSPGSVGEHYVRALGNCGIRCCTGNSADLLQEEEIQTLRSILQVIDNPQQDIPLAASLTSRVFGFTAEDMAQIRCENPYGSLYDAVRKSTREKAQEFCKTLDILREDARINTIAQLLNRVFSLTKIDSLFAAIPNGAEKAENLQQFCQIAGDYDVGGGKSLGRFLNYLDLLDERGLATNKESGAADAVTIMSIHKSKGLEFPVVFLCGLSRGFNRDSTREQILCDVEFGVGLGCVDRKNSVRYPSVAKRAIAAKMMAESLSEELRVLYVAMTRPKDRLIMTYAAQSLEKELQDLVNRMDYSDSLLMTAEVDCPGKWVLYSALHRVEAGAFFAAGGYPLQTKTYEHPWLIRLVEAPFDQNTIAAHSEEADIKVSREIFTRLQNALNFRYEHIQATLAPSKQTATQLKGRDKDAEAAEKTTSSMPYDVFRKPSFQKDNLSGKAYGTAMHAVMQYIRYQCCSDREGIVKEVQRLTEEGYISSQEALAVNVDSIAAFFFTDLGERLRSSNNVLREFKFSILEDAGRYYTDLSDEHILLQGVVDCALIEDDGITVIDFKTDRITEETRNVLADRYRNQVDIYANAISRIYQLPVKSKQLYSFCLNEFISI